MEALCRFKQAAVFRVALDSAMRFTPGQVLRLRPDLSRVRWYDRDGQLMPFNLDATAP